MTCVTNHRKKVIRETVQFREVNKTREWTMLARVWSQTRFALVGVIAAGLASSPSPSRAAAFTNGSFEMGQANINPFVTVNATNTTAITGWTVYYGSIDYVGNYWQAANGDRSVDLNGNAPGGIAQQFDVTALNIYQLSFQLSGNPDGFGNTVGATGAMTLTVYACSGLFVNLFQMNQGAPMNCDSNGATFSYDTTAQANTKANMKYVTESLKFTPSMPKETLFIVSTTQNSPYGPVIDNLVLTDLGDSSLPEPGSVALLATGLAGMAGLRRMVRRSPRSVAAKRDDCI
jgi:hypothetical protein